MVRLRNVARFISGVSERDHSWMFELGKSFGVMNGDPCRLEIVEGVATGGAFTWAIETGTYFGDTTHWLATKFARVVSIEAHDRFYNLAWRRFIDEPRVTIERGDSGDRLREVLRVSDEPVFLYLDAHWGPASALVHELETLVERADFVCMIDDFMVDNTSYLYSEFSGVAMDQGAVRQFFPDAVIYVPAYPAEEAGPRRRGYGLFGMGCGAAWLAENAEQYRLTGHSLRRSRGSVAQAVGSLPGADGEEWPPATSVVS